ncbi:MYND-type zinc finger protein MUB1 [Amniculicola lignicola CBS 123094]|uniref:MYND-type zinc finger protein samB n=1 Tax=Amniculicola lignicola CBS 123094 TaxID=1392246 RepID=A0A6A5W4H6_9PLEO|nr:MYND-type zinc finger protein MUB1 [Amniculicola lignicola CBS 123094]
MREVNFSIPNANKASVGITTALYDRRALDCTSTLPLINSLNHLAYLTTSSARIRDILTVDGGIERLVCILKDGRSKDMMDMWKWNLAFQCIFNIGVRGSENVRTRVVEADMVPVIATILDNYIKVVDKCRERAEAELRRNARLGSSRHHSSKSGEIHSTHRDRSRRTIPPPIEIPQTFVHPPLESQNGDATPTPAFSLSSPPERTTFASRTRPSHHHHHHRSHEGRGQLFATVGGTTRAIGQPLVSAMPAMETTDTFTLRPVRDADRLPSMLPALQGEITSQPESPTTPNALPARQSSPRPNGRTRRRPSIRHQLSMSGESDLDPQNEQMSPEGAAAGPAAVNEPIVGIQNDINMSDIVDNAELLEGGATPVALAAPPSEGTDENETFNITHRPALDGSIINPANTANPGPIGGFSPVQPAISVANTNPPPPWYPRYAQDRNATAGVLAAMPRDEDVLMSLQLLAYVSKYCNLRSYFQQSHLVPKLKIGSDLQLLDGGESSSPVPVEENPDEMEEYLLPDDFNIFPLVEKFTVRHHSSDMQYWASVVMRNLCRKDDSRGGIRQCAYYQCGRWEEYTRQFAKCRRCRRTKYCSKECQKSAWVFHRHWCVAAS